MCKQLDSDFKIELTVVNGDIVLTLKSQDEPESQKSSTMYLTEFDLDSVLNSKNKTMLRISPSIRGFNLERIGSNPLEKDLLSCLSYLRHCVCLYEDYGKTKFVLKSDSESYWEDIIYQVSSVNSNINNLYLTELLEVYKKDNKNYAMCIALLFKACRNLLPKGILNMIGEDTLGLNKISSKLIFE